MGYILNRYDMLNNLRQEMSTERYKQIKLTAIIVHDPKDKEFCEYVREKFLKLARLTGEHFLFITFIQPNDPWEAIQNRMGVYPSQYMVFDPSCNKDIEEAVSPLLRDLFKIKEKEGSYIVFFRDFNMREPRRRPLSLKAKPYQKIRTEPYFPYYVVKTSKDKLMNQMDVITSYCEQKSSINYIQLKNSLNARWYSAEENIIDALSQLLAIACCPDNPFNNQDADARQFFQQIKEKLWNGIQEATTLSDEMIDKLLNIYQLISISPVFCKDQEPKMLPKENHNLLDSHSHKFYESYLRLANFLENSKSVDDMDYSAFTIYLAKIVENEFNLSVFQKIRSLCQIPMPTYYNRYYSKMANLKIQTSRSQSVNINEERNNSLKSFPLGDLYYTYKALDKYNNSALGYKNEDIPKFADEMEQFWIAFKDYRNNCAHINEHTKEMYDKSRTLFNEGFMDKFLLELAEIKNKLISGNP